MLLFLDISGGEFLVILLVAFIVFGPKKVPDIARQIGRGMNELKRATGELTRELRDGVEQVKREVDNAGAGITQQADKLRDDLLKGPSDVAEEVIPTDDPAFRDVYMNTSQPVSSLKPRKGSVSRVKNDETAEKDEKSEGE